MHAQFFIMGDETVETQRIFVDAGNSDDGTGNPYPDANYTYTICPDNRRCCVRELRGFRPSNQPQPQQQRLPVHLRWTGR